MTRRRRRIAVVTGTRAEYGLLTSTMAAIRRQPGLELQVIVCGMHLLPKFGRTVRQIERDGWPIIARVPMQRGDDSPTDQAEGLARGVRGIATALERAKSDVVVVLGDRIEAMAGALAAVTTGRTLAHIHGGDVAPGDFDDALRNAITKLADIHFAASRDAARRIIAMGEDPRHVHVVGAVGLDRLRELRKIALSPPQGGEGKDRWRQCALVIYHAHGRPAAVERRTMTVILDAVRACGLRREIIWPNTDRGSSGVIAAIERHVRKHPTEATVYRSLTRDEYLRRLLSAAVLVGNSSSGVIEAPFAGTPSIDVGDRQKGRLPGGPSVIRVGEDPAAIQRAIRRASSARRSIPKRSVYGDGRAAERIARLLA